MLKHHIAAIISHWKEMGGLDNYSVFASCAEEPEVGRKEYAQRAGSYMNLHMKSS
jgi:hypothetical protein